VNNEVEFVSELPRIGAGRPHKVRPIWEGRLAPLKERPGVWAIVDRLPNATDSGATASLLRGAFPDGWKFAARYAEGEYRVYARYVGEAS
jgi:hypothetical protein